MRLKLITLAVLVGLTTQLANGNYVETDCKEFGGHLNCFTPDAIQPEDNKYLYKWSKCGIFTPEDQAMKDFNSEAEASDFIQRIDPDYDIYKNSFTPVGEWTNQPWGSYSNPFYGHPDIHYYDKFLDKNYRTNEQHIRFNPTIQYKSYVASERFYREWDVPGDTLYRIKPSPKYYCRSGYDFIWYKDLNKHPGFLCYQNSPPKFLSCSASVGNPCSITTGNKTLNEKDWSSSNSLLRVTRQYNSLISDINLDWSMSYSDKIIATQNKDANFSSIRIIKGDGSYITAEISNGNWFVDADTNLQIIQQNNTWQVKNLKTGVIEIYEKVISPTTSENTQFNLTHIDYPNGQFINLTHQNSKIATATDQLGNSLNYRYDTTGKLVQIGLPNGKTLDYGYDNLGRLITVKRPGFGVKTYIYDEADKAPNDNPNLLTGIIDENGKRYATYAYDSANRGILTEHAGSTQKFTLSFEDGVTQVTDEYGNNRSYNLALVSGTNRITHQVIAGQSIDRQYDQGGNIISETKNGLTTKYTYDQSRNLETSRIEAFGTTDSKITLTEWSENLPVKTKITEGSANPDGSLKQALRITSYTYDEKGNALSKTIIDPQTQESRTWSYTYNANAQKLSETNPQGQTSKWAYDNKGNLVQSIDAQGLTTTYSDYNANNKPQTITSPTGQVTKLTYDDAGRVLTQTITIGYPTLKELSQAKSGWIDFQNSVRKAFKKPLLPNPVKFNITKQPTQTATTTYQYDGVGQLIKTTLPDGQVISYQYDDAHRMIGMTDSLGNRISYTLNGAGDIIETQKHDPQGTLANSHKQSYDTLGRLTIDTGNNGQNQSYGYDNQDNLTQTQDALARTTGSQYDSLKRKIQDIDANGQPVNYTYNALDQLLTVTDSNKVTTSYSYNAFGDVLTTESPDTGKATNQYNGKGQVVSQTDGAGRTQNYSYDDKGRLTQRAEGSGKVLASYSYDDKGRINRLTDTSGTTTYQYNSNNQLIEKVQTTEKTVLTTRYHYTQGGQLDEIRYPSGQLAVYQYDKGILKGVQLKTIDNQTVQVIDNISYSPNGIKGYNWSQTKQAVSYQYDLDGRLTQINDPAIQRSYQYDVGNRITNLTDSKAGINGLFQHDRLDRLTNQSLTQGQTTAQLGYSYDNNANRTQKTVNGIATNTTPVKAGTNQYQAFSYDASGKVTNDGTRSYSYNSEGRIDRIQNGSVGVVNVYNALGQRVQKNSGNSKTYFVYDEQGKPLGEYDANGNPIREYLYLGNAPISLVTSEKAGQVLSIHSDHLGTPRAILGANSEVLWRWEGDAFGDVAPQVANVKMPLRMAGQYEDTETGLFYNYFRFYDPKTGRYVENDPIDLAGGLNRWGYVSGSPLEYSDPSGLCPMCLAAAPAIATAIGEGISAIATGIATAINAAPVAAAVGVGVVAVSIPSDSLIPMAGIAPYPNTISHAREKEILNMNGYEPCNELEKALEDLKTTIAWRKSDLNPAEKGTKVYADHQKYIKKLQDHKDKLKRRFDQYCKENCIDVPFFMDKDEDSK